MGCAVLPTQYLTGRSRRGGARSVALKRVTPSCTGKREARFYPAPKGLPSSSRPPAFIPVST